VAGDCLVTYRTGVAPRTGLSARIELQVAEADTAEAFRTGSVPVPLELLDFGLRATLRRLGSVALRDAPAANPTPTGSTSASATTHAAG